MFFFKYLNWVFGIKWLGIGPRIRSYTLKQLEKEITEMEKQEEGFDYGERYEGPSHLRLPPFHELLYLLLQGQDLALLNGIIYLEHILDGK